MNIEEIRNEFNEFKLHIKYNQKIFINKTIIQRILQSKKEKPSKVNWKKEGF